MRPGILAAVAVAAWAAGAAADEIAGADEAVTEDGGPRLDVGLDGYYRARAYAVGNVLYLHEAVARSQYYLTQRLRLQPVVSYGDYARLHVTVDCLDNVVWGDNAGLASTPLFASDPSLTGLTGSEVPYVLLRHAWIEADVRLGIVRVGRQPSHWGLGLLTDAGEGFDDDFGDNRYGSSYDRVLFATMPISVGRAIAGLDPGETPLILAVAYDKLVEQPLDEGSTRPIYESAWLADNEDDVDQWTVALAWKQDDLDLLAPTDSIAAGVYFVYRDQASTRSKVYIVDGFFKLHLHDFFAEGEALWIGGTSSAIPLGPEQPDGLYAEKEADILGWLVRAGWRPGRWTIKVEAGYASGDDNPNDREFTGMALHPDVNVGLLMYEELLAELTRAAWVDNDGMWSKGGVYNSHYLTITGIVEPIDGLEILLGVLSAWVDKPDGAVLLNDGWLGTEIDLAVRYRFHGDTIRAVLEGGWLRPANGPLDLAEVRLVNTEMWTVQSRIAFVF
ncbi:MAG: hypothetical protein QME96_00150 [Myxococcota bacterium]|nr:hypothetical protein [Myxococcota bacterium]